MFEAEYLPMKLTQLYYEVRVFTNTENIFISYLIKINLDKNLSSQVYTESFVSQKYKCMPAI